MIEQLDVTRSVFTVRDFVSWFQKNEIDLRPRFQRLDVWKPKAKSFLIDTALKGLPFPIIILRDSPGISLTPMREVVDGQQRLTSLLTYICPDRFPKDKQFTIFKAHSPELAGKSFADLPDYAKKLLLNYEISTHILPSNVDDQQVLRIFARLNATGSVLNPQELRNAEYHGAFKTFAFDLSLQFLDYWLGWKLFSPSDFSRMKEVEFISDLIIRVTFGTTGGSQGELDKIYRENDDDFNSATIVKKRCETIFGEIDTGFSSAIGTTQFRKLTWFYALFGTVHDMLYEGVATDSNAGSIAKKSLDKPFWQKVQETSDLLERPESLSAATLALVINSKTNLTARKDREKFLSEQFA